MISPPIIRRNHPRVWVWQSLLWWKQEWVTLVTGDRWPSHSTASQRMVCVSWWSCKQGAPPSLKHAHLGLMLADHFCFHVNPQKSNVYYNICIIKYIHTHKHTDVNQKLASKNAPQFCPCEVPMQMFYMPKHLHVDFLFLLSLSRSQDFQFTNIYSLINVWFGGFPKVILVVWDFHLEGWLEFHKRNNITVSLCLLLYSHGGMTEWISLLIFSLRRS